MAKRKGTIGYMCMTDFDHELGAAHSGSTIYPSIEAIKEFAPCVKQCGIVKVEVIFKSTVQAACYDAK